MLQRGFIGTLLLLVIAILLTYHLTSQYYEKKIAVIEATSSK